MKMKHSKNSRANTEETRSKICPLFFTSVLMFTRYLILFQKVNFLQFIINISFNTQMPIDSIVVFNTMDLMAAKLMLTLGFYLYLFYLLCFIVFLGVRFVHNKPNQIFRQNYSQIPSCIIMPLKIIHLPFFVKPSKSLIT